VSGVENSFVFFFLTHNLAELSISEM